MSFGRGFVTGIANKHKTNAKSSTGAELIGANDAKPQMFLTSYFVEAQGFTIDDSVLFRDNLSAMSLVSSKRTKHIRVRYYFVKDRITAGDIVVKHCPTREILADHFTKPLQGALFRKFRAEIQGIPATMDDEEMGWDAPGPFNVPLKAVDTATGIPSPQECVGKDRISALSIGPSPNIGGREGLGNESCQEGTRNDRINIRLQPQIIYCEAANRGLTHDILRQQ